ncbi:carbon-nitrogen hydrolase family protein [Thalassococcus sp. CAU 1522]|uniref:Carbon-nitrogen hydrolase family protein n=1 Tax=Thalassococcus arenae TaxID=2851652 RepID=A0ABS6N8Q9_9RHOB|nr:carbon-nitrogen hydrolase family protein [Thalassococcus arenae]MBV2360389.1 carbon-nitrogen hydrolase family protein [Thalassococcus arenae]
MKVAAAAYPMDFFDNEEAYREKLTDWVSRGAGEGAQLLVFPEYGAMELATLAGADIAADLEASLHAVSERVPMADALHADLARRFGVHILAASAPVFDPALGVRPVNRARLFAPSGAVAQQDKQVMTRFERETWHVQGGGALQIFDTALCRIGVLICYDAEFPLLGRALSQADVILVPSCTEALTGYSRVRIGAMARALENQCVTVMSSTVGSCPWSPAVDTNTGAGGVYGPPDRGFPETGILAQGSRDAPGWTYAEIDLAAIARVRADGGVLNRRDWADQQGRDGAAALRRLR